VHEIAKEAPMTIYCGVDFHARQQTICFCDTADGATCLKELRHDRDDVRGFYAQFTGDVIVGLEASGYSTWFVELLEGLGHQVFIGEAASGFSTRAMSPTRCGTF
jgi:transposase